MLSVCKTVKTSLSFAAVVKGKRNVNHVNVCPSVLRSDNGGWQPKVLGSRKAVQYGKSSRHREVVKDSSTPALHQGGSHMGGHVGEHVKGKGKQSLICSDNQIDRFVHKNRFQLLIPDDMENGMESQCQNIVSTCENSKNQVGASLADCVMKDGSKSVRGKLTNPSKCSNLAVNSNCVRSVNCSKNTVTSGFPALNMINTAKHGRVVDETCKNHSESANSAVHQSLGVPPVVGRLGTGGKDRIKANGGENTVTIVNQATNIIADKYALELQSTKKKDKLNVARQAPDNTLCIAQNAPLFGFIPIYGLKSQVVDKCDNNECTDLLQLHKMLRQDGRYNYEGLQIPVPSKLNPKVWEKYLQQYWDWQLPLLIKFGFPLDFDRDSVITSHDINHKSATEYPDHVAVYLAEELQHQAILGPFKHPPIDKLHTSPFMTRDKPNSANRRVIIDLSWPLGESVNAGVPSDKYLGTEFVLTYPSVDNITQDVLRLGRGCKIFKVDISRAFRHVPIDPGDLDLLGLH